jgi:SNF2 family DNA or RNA helicase
VEKLAPVAWNAVALDEAQAIKNPESQVTRAAYRLKARWRMALTGTPVENRLDELWSQLHFLNPGLLGGRSDFEDRYAKPIAEGAPGAAAKLRERLWPFLLRRLERDVAPELPPRTEMVEHCELTQEERAVYEAIRAATREEIVSRLRAGGSVLAALEARSCACARRAATWGWCPGRAPRPPRRWSSCSRTSRRPRRTGTRPWSSRSGPRSSTASSRA